MNCIQIFKFIHYQVFYHVIFAYHDVSQSVITLVLVRLQRSQAWEGLIVLNRLRDKVIFHRPLVAPAARRLQHIPQTSDPSSL